MCECGIICIVLLFLHRLGALLSLSKEMPSSNEGELLANNTTRAELFAGLYGALVTSTAAPATDAQALEKLLTSYFIEHVEKVEKRECRHMFP